MNSASHALLVLLCAGSLLLVLYTYAGYPLVAAAVARRHPRPWCRGGGPALSVSIIMPVHNALDIVPAKMRHLCELSPKTVHEIIVISDGSTDGTAELLTTFTDSRLRVITLEYQAGKAEALNHGMRAATGDVLLFVDVRPRMEDGAVEHLISNFADASVGCAAGELIVRRGAQHDATGNAVGGAYWRYEQGIRTAEALWDSPVGVYGGFYAVRRALATPFPPGLILDDMFQPLSIIRQGYRSVLDRAATVVDTWPSSNKGEFQRKVRTLAGNFQLMKQAPWLLSGQNRVRFQLVSHKLLRLAVPYALVLLVLCPALLAPGRPVWGLVAGVQAVFWLLSILALRVRIPVLHRVLGPASALLLLNAAAVAGLYRFLFTSGPLWQIWSPASNALAENQAALWGGQEPVATGAADRKTSRVVVP